MTEQHDKEIELQIVWEAGGGQKIRCIYLNDYRVIGSKPYVSENLAHTIHKIKLRELANAIGYLFKQEQSND